MNRIIPNGIAALITSATFFAVPANADPVGMEATRGSDAWQFGALIYIYYPAIGGQATLPNGTTSSITVDASDLVSNLKFGFLGSFEARKGVWGAFSDVMYMNVGQFNSHYHNLLIGNVGLPADVSSSTNFDMKSVLWTLAGTYRAAASQSGILDVIAGARLLDEKVTVDWTLNGNLGPIPAPGRGGSIRVKQQYIDGIVGLKGRVVFGTDRKWFLPYYGDIGAGDSDLTWQIFGGLGYALNWGELVGGWRYMDYKFKSDSAISSTNFNGPALGAAFHW
jgi:hypothetical protein